MKPFLLHLLFWLQFIAPLAFPSGLERDGVTKGRNNSVAPTYREDFQPHLLFLFWLFYLTLAFPSTVSEATQIEADDNVTHTYITSIQEERSHVISCPIAHITSDEKVSSARGSVH